MKTKVLWALFMFGFGIATAEASTLRVTCDDQATGAEVSINGKYKGECPIDIQVNEGKHRLKAVKKIAGKNAVFEQEIRMGDGVTKRIEVSFGAAQGAAAPAIQIDRNAIAQQRYAAEMDEYNRSIQACLPKHAIELSRLKQAVQMAYKAKWNECVQENSHNISLMVAAGRSAEQQKTGYCGNRSWNFNSSDDDNPYGVNGDLYRTDEYKTFEAFDNNAESWCKKQFTKPTAP